MEDLTNHFKGAGVSSSLFKRLKKCEVSCDSVDKLHGIIREVKADYAIILEKLQNELLLSEQLPVQKHKAASECKPNLIRRIQCDGILVGAYPHRLPYDNSLYRSISFLLGNRNLAWEALYLLVSHCFVKRFLQIEELEIRRKIFKYLTKGVNAKVLLLKFICNVIERDIIIYDVSKSKTTIRRFTTNFEEGRMPIILALKNERFTPIEQEGCILSCKYGFIGIELPLFYKPPKGPALPTIQNKKLDELLSLSMDYSQKAVDEFRENQILDEERMYLVRSKEPVEHDVPVHGQLARELENLTLFFRPLQTSGNESTVLESVVVALTGKAKFTKSLMAIYIQNERLFNDMKISSEPSLLQYPYNPNEPARVCMILYRRISVFTITEIGMRCDYFTPPFTTFQNSINILNHFGKFYALKESVFPIWTEDNCIIHAIEVDYAGNRKDNFREKISLVPIPSNTLAFPPTNLRTYSFIPTSLHVSVIKMFPSEEVCKNLLTQLSVSVMTGTKENKLNSMNEIFSQCQDIKWDEIFTICQFLPMSVWSSKLQNVSDSIGQEFLIRNHLNNQFIADYIGEDTFAIFKAISIVMFGTGRFHVVVRLLCVYALFKKHSLLENISVPLKFLDPKLAYWTLLSKLLEPGKEFGEQTLLFSIYLTSILFKREFVTFSELQFGNDLQLDASRFGVIGPNFEPTGNPFYVLRNGQRISILLLREDFQLPEGVANHVIGTVDDIPTAVFHPVAANVSPIDSSRLVEAANYSLRGGDHVLFSTHESHELLSSFPLSLAYDQTYLAKMNTISSSGILLSTGVVVLQQREETTHNVSLIQDLDQLMKKSQFKGYLGCEVANRMDFMIYEARRTDFQSLPLTDNTIYTYCVDGELPHDFLNENRTISDEFPTEPYITYYVGITGTLFPLQISRYLANTVVKNYGTSSMCWIIICQHYAMELQRLLTKLTHSGGYLSDCQIAYGQVAYMSMQALRRNGIPFQLRELKPGETLVIRAGSFYQAVCSGICVFRIKQMILCDYPTTVDNWSLIPACYCHPEDRTTFLEIMENAMQIQQPSSADAIISQTCHTVNVSNIGSITIKSDSRPQESNPLQHHAPILSQTTAQTPDPTVPTLSQTPHPVISSNTTSVLPHSSTSLPFKGAISTSHTNVTDPRPGTSSSTRERTSRLYPNLLNVEVTDFGNDFHSPNYEEIESEGDAAVNGVEGKVKRSPRTEFAACLGLHTEKETKKTDHKMSYITLRREMVQSEENTRIEKERQRIAKLSKRKLSQTRGAIAARAKKAAQVAEDANEIAKKLKKTDDEYEKEFLADLERVKNGEKLYDSTSKLTKKQKPSNRYMASKKRNDMGLLEGYNTPAAATVSGGHIMPPVSQDLAQPARVSTTTPKRTLRSSTRNNPKIEEFKVNVQDSNNEDDEHEIENQNADVSDEDDASEGKEDEMENQNADVSDEDDASEGKEDEMENQNADVSDEDDTSDEDEESEDEDEKDRKERQRRKAPLFKIGIIPPGDDSILQPGRKNVYVKSIPGAEGTYLSFGYKIKGDKRVVCKGPCCKGKKDHSSLSVFRKHVHAATRRYPCGKCSQVFSRKQALTEHNELIHPKKSRKFTCDKCKAKFDAEKYLKRHKRDHCPFRPQRSANTSDEESDSDESDS